MKKQYVLAYIFSRDLKKVLLIHKTKPEHQKGLLNGIGGKVEEGESAHEAMERECKEECGLENLDFSTYLILQGEHWAVTVFAAIDPNDLETAQSLEEEKVSAYPVIWILTMPPHKVMYHLHWSMLMGLENLRSGQPVIATADCMGD